MNLREIVSGHEKTEVSSKRPHSTLESRCSGFAFNTTKIKMGKNASAPSSLWRCLNRPKERVDGKPERGRETVVSQTTTDHWKRRKRYFGPKMTLQQLSTQISLSLGAL